MNIDINTLRTQFLQECSEDFVGLWSLVNRLRNSKLIEPSRLREETLGLIADLLERRDIVAGRIAQNNFVECNISTPEIIDKIRSEWASLGRDPDIGEIIWFTAPYNEEVTPIDDPQGE